MAVVKNNQTKSKVGGARPGAGRKKGSPNKATASLREVARQYTEEAVETFLACIRSDSAPWAAKVAAAGSILDRGYGKPSQVIAGDDEGGPLSIVSRVELIALDGNSTG